MRKIVAGMFCTLDGVIEAPEKWNPPYYDDELNRAVFPLLTDAGTHLYGRRSYDLFRAVFTGPAAPPHAGLMTAAQKAVVTSRPLGDPAWGHTTVISGDVASALTALKRQPGGDIAVAASGTLVRFLLQAGLLDELYLFVHPVVVGTGRHLFEDGGSLVPLTLLESRAHGNGVVALRYSGRGLRGSNPVAGGRREPLVRVPDHPFGGGAVLPAADVG